MQAAILICGLVVPTACSSKDSPAEPDYRDSTQWYITDRGAAADVFYIISTETGDYTHRSMARCWHLARNQEIS